MNQADRNKERQPRKHERLSAEGIISARTGMAKADMSAGRVYPLLMRLLETEPLRPDASRTETYQSADGGRQFQFAPIVGASAVQPDFAARAERMEVSNGRIDLADADEYRQPGYLTENEPVNSAVAEAERLVQEAYRNSAPQAAPSNVTPSSVTFSDAKNSAVLEAERVVAEAYLNGPSYSSSQENEYAA